MGLVDSPGIVTGLHAEAALIGKFTKHLDRQPKIACAGPGASAAREAAGELISKGAGGLISFGFAGGIDETITAGTVVLPCEIRQGREDTIHTNEIWRRAVHDTIGRSLNVTDAPIASVNEIVSEASEKTRLRYHTGAAAIDMESFAVARLAADAGLPFIAIRAVSDPALQSLPIMALDAVDESGKLRLWRILRSLILHPGQIGELRRLAANMRAATDALSAVCRQIAPDFCLPDFRGVLIRQLRELN